MSLPWWQDEKVKPYHSDPAVERPPRVTQRWCRKTRDPDEYPPSQSFLRRSEKRRKGNRTRKIKEPRGGGKGKVSIYVVYYTRPDDTGVNLTDVPSRTSGTPEDRSLRRRDTKAPP